MWVPEVESPFVGKKKEYHTQYTNIRTTQSCSRTHWGVPLSNVVLGDLGVVVELCSGLYWYEGEGFRSHTVGSNRGSSRGSSRGSIVSSHSNLVSFRTPSPVTGLGKLWSRGWVGVGRRIWTGRWPGRMVYVESLRRTVSWVHNKN